MKDNLKIQYQKAHMCVQDMQKCRRSATEENLILNEN